MAIDSISAYQLHVSPKKGFSCAHRLLHQGESCSQYAKNLLINGNLITAVNMSRQRFKACAAASQTLKTTKASGGCIIVPCCLPIPL
ncbi:membrane protein insertion efficiency factor YidD [Lyngbya aestuarii]|uniref:membrane protein insertion efficiency factor YidD n=1 Tax=Lyngbya aestuarii TaxID=118322 RepID=UPI00403E14CD